jgi:hydroxypyruvate isomerase
MIKLSACLEMLFPEIENFVDRIPAAAKAGLDAFEFWGYAGKDLEAIAKASQKTGLPVAALIVDAPEGMLDMHLADAFVEAVQNAIAAARIVNCKSLIATVGWGKGVVDRAWGHAGIVACLKAAAPLAEAAGVTLVLEPLNVLVDHAGYFLTTSAEGFEIVEQVKSPAVKLLFDIYHQQITEGNLIANITSHIDDIGHFHVADNPGRYEPGTGEINYANVLAAINEAGYQKYVGLEFRPSKPTPEALKGIVAIRDALNR